MDTKQMFHGFYFRSHTDSTIGKLIRQEFIVLILPFVVVFFFTSRKCPQRLIVC